MSDYIEKYDLLRKSQSSLFISTNVVRVVKLISIVVTLAVLVCFFYLPIRLSDWASLVDDAVNIIRKDSSSVLVTVAVICAIPILAVIQLLLTWYVSNKFIQRNKYSSSLSKLYQELLTEHYHLVTEPTKWEMVKKNISGIFG
jgi:membrane-anchored glycerophosphoryl diester phosphodiesterase (GDPDase)